MKYSLNDRSFMLQALRLAKLGQFSTSPNPKVGCVIVKDNEVVGQGFHLKAGDDHAEVMALKEAKTNAKGATVYVTLEPCAHFGRTPPCANALIKAGVERVVVACLDPNPKVSGMGVTLLRQAKIKCSVGLCERQALWVNRDFFHQFSHDKPYVKVKMAMSIDGKTALKNGNSKWITNEKSRQDVQLERARSDVILSTCTTVKADNARLNVRMSNLPRIYQQNFIDNGTQPLRVIIDRQAKLHKEDSIFSIQSHVWLVTRSENITPTRRANYAELAQLDFVKIIDLDKLNISDDESLNFVLQQLYQENYLNVWVEAGANLVGSLIDKDLVDELIVYIAPKILGNEARALCVMPNLEELSKAKSFHLEQSQILEDDLKINYIKTKIVNLFNS